MKTDQYVLPGPAACRQPTQERVEWRAKGNKDLGLEFWEPRRSGPMGAVYPLFLPRLIWGPETDPLFPAAARQAAKGKMPKPSRLCRRHWLVSKYILWGFSLDWGSTGAWRRTNVVSVGYQEHFWNSGDRKNLPAVQGQGRFLEEVANKLDTHLFSILPRSFQWFSTQGPPNGWIARTYKDGTF